jgi:hypothetical protein
MFVNGHPDWNRNVIFLEGLDALHRFKEISFASASIVSRRNRAIDGDLHPITATRCSQKRCHTISDQCSITQDVEPHPIANNSFNKFWQILSAKRLSPLKSHVHDCTPIQLLEEFEPFLFGQILAHIARTGEVAAVCAPQIAAISYR